MSNTLQAKESYSSLKMTEVSQDTFSLIFQFWAVRPSTIAGVVGDATVDKLKVKEKPTYAFPDISDHETEYLGRHFMVIESIGKDSINLHQVSFVSINLKEYDFTLLDGTYCCPISNVKIVTNGQIFGRLVIGFIRFNFLSVDLSICLCLAIILAHYMQFVLN